MHINLLKVPVLQKKISLDLVVDLLTHESIAMIVLILFLSSRFESFSRVRAS